MNSRKRGQRRSFVVALAIASGVAIAAVDNFAFGGEVSPIVVVALLLLATAVVGTFATRRRWLVALAVWMWLPGAHLIKHALGLPDTIQPSTYASIFLLGAFSLAVTVVGMGCGLIVRRMMMTAGGARDGKSA